MRQFFRLAFIALVCTSWSTADARVAIIPGWSFSQSENGMVMSTPCGGGADMMVYGIYPAYTTNTDNSVDWLNGQVSKLTSGWTGFRGSVIKRSEVSEQGPLLYQTVEFTDAEGVSWSAVIMGTTVGQLGQLYSIVASTNTDERDPRFQAALENAFGLIRDNFTLDPRSIAQVPVRNSAVESGFGQIWFGLQTSKLRWFMQHRVDTTPQTLLVTQQALLFEGPEVSAYSFRGSVRPIGKGPNGVYELKYNDGTIDIIPTACFLSWPPGGASSDASANAPISSAPPAAPPVQPAATVRSCRTVVKEVLSTTVQMQCDYRGICTQRPVTAVRKQNVEVCD